MRKKSIKTLKRELTNACSQYTKKKTKGKCEMCGKEGINAHHIYSKGRFGAIRYDIDNLVWLCFDCHFNGAHGGNPDYFKWLLRYKRQEELDRIKAKGQAIKKWKREELENILKELEDGKA